MWLPILPPPPFPSRPAAAAYLSRRYLIRPQSPDCDSSLSLLAALQTRVRVKRSAAHSVRPFSRLPLHAASPFNPVPAASHQQRGPTRSMSPPYLPGPSASSRFFPPGRRRLLSRPLTPL